MTLTKLIYFNLTIKIPYSHISSKGIHHRDALRAYLFENGIETGIHYKPNHQLKKFTDGQPRVVTEKLAEELITLPLHYDLSDDDLLFIIEKLNYFFKSI